MARFAESFQSFHYGSQKVNTYFTGLEWRVSRAQTRELGPPSALAEFKMFLIIFEPPLAVKRILSDL